MAAGEVIEHAAYLRDGRKLDGYRAALVEVVTPTSAVLDLGAGTGILGLLAASAGARVVYAVDWGSIIGVAKEIAEANGLDDKIVHVQGNSTKLDLPEPIDVVVCDQIGGHVYDAGVLDYFADARSRLLAPGGQMVPRAFTLLVAPVEADVWRETVGIWSSQPAGFDFGSMANLAANTAYRHRLSERENLATPSAFATITADHNDKIAGITSLSIERAGELNGIAGYFVAELSPSISLSNIPGRVDTFDRWQHFYPLPEPVDVDVGDRVEVSLDIRPSTRLATWTVLVDRRASGGQLIRHRGSTVLGQFLSEHDIRSITGRTSPQRSPALDADRAILAAVDGSKTQQDIAAEIAVGWPQVFETNREAEARVRHLLGRHLPSDPP